MAEGLNVRISGKLREFVEEQTGPDGLYESASEYVRDLVRQDYKRREEKKWNWLQGQLQPALHADESEFASLNAEDIIQAAKQEKACDAH
ncbi:type II toxin-antitoxin system ParD family antitoxin [bacterium]|nr:type II toxin-antitoxin system ParD family antitoxin [bacterium]